VGTANFAPQEAVAQDELLALAMHITMEQHKQYILQSNMLSRTYHVWLIPPTILAVESMNRPDKAVGTAHFAPQEEVAQDELLA
jgi:hypothetical protein